VESLNSKKSIDLLLLVGILIIALNLRPALASVGPLIDDIRDSTGLSSFMLGLLTTLPLIAFSIISLITPLFTRKFGIGGTLFATMLLLTIGIGIRFIPWIPALYIGALLAGIAIAFGNVLLPSLTKQNFESNAGLITSLYSSMMAGGAALAAGVSIPLAYDLDLGWRGSLSIWSILSFMALIIWYPQLSRLSKSNPHQNYLSAMRKLGASKLARQVALFMGFQSLTFYVILAWLPAILQSRGFDASFSGWMLSLSQATGILGSLTFPIIAGRRNDQRGLVMILCTIEFISLVGLFFPELGLIWLWVTILGFGLGGSFGLSLLFIVIRSKDANSTTELSGMAQSIGYFIAGIGPIAFGSLYDLTGSWSNPIILLFVVTFLKLIVGLGAGKPIRNLIQEKG
jgi:CP family cyanate transporter-like MFS transporter